MISMDFVSMLLLGFSSMFNDGINVVNARIIPSKNHLQSHDYYDFFEPNEFDFTTGIHNSEFDSGERGQDGGDSGSSELEELLTSSPFHSSLNIFAGNSQEDNDFSFDKNEVKDGGSTRIATQGSIHRNVDIQRHDGNDESIDTGIRNNNVGESPNYSPPDKFYIPTYTFRVRTTTPRYISENVDEEYEFSGSGDVNKNKEDSYRGLSNQDYGNSDTKVDIEIDPIRKNSFDEVPSQIVVSENDDEDFEFSGSGDGIRDYNDSDYISSELPRINSTFTPPFTMNAHTEDSSRSIYVAEYGNENNDNRKVNLSTIGIFESTSQYVPKTNFSKSENSGLSSSADGSGDERNIEISDISSKKSFHSYTTARNIYELFEITTKYLPKNIFPDSDDEDYDSSGSGDESGDENNIHSPDTFSHKTSHSLYTTSSTEDNYEQFETITQHLLKNKFSNSDDKDYQSFGSGDGNSDESNIVFPDTSIQKTFHLLYTPSSTGDTHGQGHYPKTAIPDHHHNRKNGNDVHFPRKSSLEITTQRLHSKNIAPDSDDMEIEYSGSGDESGGENVTSSSDFEIKARYLSKNIVTDSDDEDYELSGSGEESEHGVDTNYPSAISNTKNGREAHPPTIITQKYFSGTITPDSDNEKFEYSASSDGSGRDDEDFNFFGNDEGSGSGADTNSLDLYSEKLYSPYITLSRGRSNDDGDTKIKTEVNPTTSSFGIITKRFHPKIFIPNSDDEEFTFSGSGDGSGG